MRTAQPASDRIPRWGSAAAGSAGGRKISGTGTLIVGGSVSAAGAGVGCIAGQPFSLRAGVVAGGTVSTTVVDIAVRVVCSSPAGTVPAG